MAEKNLQSIKFPQLGNVYKIPQVEVDTTLTVSGKAADAKKAGDRISAVDTKVGNLSDLETTDKSSIVDAINEARGTGGGGGSLATLSDVHLANLSNGQAITYDSATQKWKNVTIGGGGSVTIDSEISGTSTNPVQNKVIKGALDTKANASDIPTKTSDLANDSGFITSAPVTSVNGQTGAVSLVIPSTASDVGAISAPSSPATGAFLVWNGSAWVAQTLSTWQGGSY